MWVGFSPDGWTKAAAGWLREPIAQGLLLSLALHLALAVVIQPASGTNRRNTLVINARLQPAATRLASEQSEIVAEPVVVAKPSSPTDILSATTPSPAPPVPLTPAPVKASAVEPAVVMPPSPSTATASAPAVSAAAPADKSNAPAADTGLPSLPIDIDTNWYQARQVDVHPKAIGVIEPAYPEEAKRRNIEGTLKLMLKIDDLGRVQSAEVVEATPPGVFDEAALAAFRGAHFRPAMRDGRPVRYQAYMRVEFKLKD
jgi:protein TonB